MKDRATGSAAAPAVAALFLVTTVLVVAGFAFGSWLPEVASHHGAGVDAVIRYLLVSTGVLFVIGHVVLAVFVLRYSKGGARRPAVVSSKIEWRWALVPVVVMCVIAEGGVVIVGMPVFAEVWGEAPEDSLELEVVGKQFEWFIRYPGPDGLFGRTDHALVHDVRNPVGLDGKDPAAKDDVVTRGALHLPVNRPVFLRLRSLDVIHSFTVPEFRSKQDLIPGFGATTQFIPTRSGRFEIACAELCGLGHYRMRGFATVESDEEFDAWLKEQEPWL